MDVPKINANYFFNILFDYCFRSAKSLVTLTIRQKIIFANKSKIETDFLSLIKNDDKISQIRCVDHKTQ
jgi:hypothetical protein